MRYFLVYGKVLPMLQRSEGTTTTTRRLLSLAECDEVHTELTQALDVRTSARREWRSTQAADLRGARLRGAIRHHLPMACRGLRSSSLGSHGLCPLIDDRLRAGFTNSEHDASGTPCGVDATTPEPPASSNSYLPAPTLGARSVLAAKKGATAT